MDGTGGSHAQEQGLNFADWPTLKLVMIGVREAGKSAAGNAILGKKAFDEVGVKTKASVSCQGLGQGMQLLVVDTPGWEWFDVRGTSASTWTLKKEIIRNRKQLQGSSLKQEVEENEELHRLVEKCGGCFHALYSTPQGGENQVANLLTKIKKIVASNGDVVLSSEKILKWAQERETER
ncbi:putative GTPase IMAP family member 4-like [Triplophysa rosa]|uniref:GTPase IMAP family member 4-like n=1 Tax=Triplophysa rosa TaxID=992332 RepID=A0A9W7TVS9_TRIRA|nr:putative GTPase IMAP family member 4-like [Triplophysa rosa]